MKLQGQYRQEPRLHKGHIRADGKIFRYYDHSRVDSEGYYYECWMSPDAMVKRETRRLARESERRQEDKADPVKVARRREIQKKASAKSRNENHARWLLWQARGRARARGLECTIELEDVVVPTHCPVLGIELTRGVGQATDSSAQLDRIHNHKGYVKGNVIVVSRRANRLKSDSNVEELRRIVQYYEQFSDHDSPSLG